MVLNRYKFNNFELKTFLQIRTFKPVEQHFYKLFISRHSNVLKKP